MSPQFFNDYILFLKPISLQLFEGKIKTINPNEMHCSVIFHFSIWLHTDISFFDPPIKIEEFEWFYFSPPLKS